MVDKTNALPVWNCNTDRHCWIRDLDWNLDLSDLTLIGKVASHDHRHVYDCHPYY